ARQVLAARRRGVVRDVVGAVERTEERAPTELVLLPVPHAARELLRRDGVVAVVEHRGEQELSAHLRAAAVARHEGDARGEPGPRADASDEASVQVDAEASRVLLEPRQG